MSDQVVIIEYRGVDKNATVAKKVADAQKKIADETKKSGKATDKTTSSFKAFTSGLGAAQAAMIAFAGSAVVKGIYELIKLDAAIESTTTRLDFMTKGHADEYVDSIVQSSRYLISEQDALQVSLKLVGLQLVDNEQQAADLATKIAVLGQTFKGIDAGQAADEFALLMANMSIPRLDGFGLSASKVKARIDELMATTAGMTKEAAFQQAVMEELDIAYNRIGGQVETLGSDIQLLESGWKDLKQVGSEWVGEVLGPAIRNAADLSIMLRDMKNAQEAYNISTAQSAKSFEEWVSLQADVHQMNGRLQQLNYEMQSGQEISNQYAGMVKRLRKEYEEYSNAALEAQRASDLEGWNAFMVEMGMVADTTEEATVSIEDQEEALRQAEQAHQEYIKSLTDQHRAQLDLIGSSTEHIAAMQELNMYYGEGYGQLERSQAVGQQWLDILASTDNQYRLTGSALDDYMVKQGLASEEAIKLAGAQQAVVDAMEQGRINVQQAGDIYAGVMSGQVEDVEAATAAQEALNVQMMVMGGFSAEELGLADTFEEAKEPTQAIAEQFGAMAESVRQLEEFAPGAFETLSELAPTTAEALKPFHDSLMQSAGYLTSMMTGAPAWAAALNDAGAAIAAEGSGTGLAASQLEGMRKAWEYLVLNPRIALEALVTFTTTGGIPGAAGGMHTTVDHPQWILAGEAGRERIDITPMTPGPHPPPLARGIPAFASGGSITAGYPSTGGGGVTINNLNVTLPSVRNARDFIPDLLTELGHLGMYIPERRIAA